MKYVHYVGLFTSTYFFFSQAPVWLIALFGAGYFMWQIHYQNNTKEMR